MKVVNFSFIGHGHNSRGYSYSSRISAVVYVNEPVNFKDIRDAIKRDWKLVLGSNPACTNEFRYHFLVSISENGYTRFRDFTIDPKRMK